MNLFEFRFAYPQYITGPAPNWTDPTTRANAESEAVVAGTIEESLLVFKRNRPGVTIIFSITYQGPALI